MNGFITKSMLLMGLIGGLGTMSGCYGKKDLIDPCYPERYQYMARREVVEAFTPQVHNGHILDQTIWNHHFEYDEARGMGTDRLAPGGMEHLAYLAPRRPQPDTTVYVQTAQDINYDGVNPERFVEDRYQLDARRVEAVQKYLNSYAAGRNFSFNVCLHDPSEVGMSGIAARASVSTLSGSAQGVLSIGGRGTGATTNANTNPPAPAAPPPSATPPTAGGP